MARNGLLAAWLAAGAISAGSIRANAGTSPVSLGEVRVDKGDPALEPEFRGVIERELGRLDLGPARAGDRYVLSAALQTTTTRDSAGHTESIAVVSATLRRARGGALHAVIHGRAQVVDPPKQSRAVELSAMRAAVKSALRRVPEAIK